MENFREKLFKFSTQLSYVPKTLCLIWSSARGWTLAWLVLLCVEGLLPAALVHLSRLFIDSLAAAIGTGWSWENVRPAAFPALLMAGVLALTELAQGVSSWVRAAQAEL